jgi:hypothetical protein
MDGKIHPDGSADLVVTGYSGEPAYSPGNEKPGTPLRYEVKAKFGGDNGTGDGVGYRPRAYSFVRRARWSLKKEASLCEKPVNFFYHFLNCSSEVFFNPPID